MNGFLCRRTGLSLLLWALGVGLVSAEPTLTVPNPTHYRLTDGGVVWKGKNGSRPVEIRLVALSEGVFRLRVVPVSLEEPVEQLIAVKRDWPAPPKVALWEKDGSVFLDPPGPLLLQAWNRSGRFSILVKHTGSQPGDYTQDMWLPTSPIAPGQLIVNPEKPNYIGFDDLFDRYLIYGRDCRDKLKKYITITGRPALPPRWAFGFQFGTYYPQKMLLALARKIRRERLPCDAIWLDSIWLNKGDTKAQTGFIDFQFNMAHPYFQGGLEMLWPDPQEMAAELHRLHFRWGLWVWPYIGRQHQTKRQAELFQEGATRGFFVKNADGLPREVKAWHDATRAAMVDFTNPQAYAWWKGLLIQLIREYRLDFLKTDGGMDGVSSRTFGEGGVAVFHRGRSFQRYGNLWFYLYNHCAAEALREATGRRPFLWTHQYRTGIVPTYAGKHRFPGLILLGDTGQSWESLAALIRSSHALSRVGVSFWTNDIGGYKRAAERVDPELYVRWAQFEFLGPYPEVLGDTRPNPERMRREPWSFDSATYAAFRRIAQLRARLIPYLYSSAFQYHRTGVPFVRPLDMEFPDEEFSPSAEYQYLLGDFLLVAPIYRKGTPATRPVYLPEGVWIDFWTDETFAGGQEIVYTVPLDRVPLFVRGGAILPMGPVIEYDGQRPWNPLTLAIYPGAERSAFTLYEDDGLTEAYRDGVYRLTEIEVTQRNDVHVEIRPPQGNYPGLAERTWELVIHGQTQAPTQVLLGDRPLDRAADRQALETMPLGWWYDPDARQVRVRVVQRDDALRIQVRGPE